MSSFSYLRLLANAGTIKCRGCRLCKARAYWQYNRGLGPSRGRSPISPGTVTRTGTVPGPPSPPPIVRNRGRSPRAVPSPICGDGDAPSSPVPVAGGVRALRLGGAADGSTNSFRCSRITRSPHGHQHSISCGEPNQAPSPELGSLGPDSEQPALPTLMFLYRTGGSSSSCRYDSDVGGPP